MPGIVLKLDREHDAYAIFSTVVDGFTTYAMTKDETFEYLKRFDANGLSEEQIYARVVRAELSGTSMKDGEYGFDDGPVLFLDGGACEDLVPRDQLYARMLAEMERDGQELPQ